MRTDINTNHVYFASFMLLMSKFKVMGIIKSFFVIE